MINKKKLELENKYSFKSKYINDYENFKKKILEKKIIPYQVEFQAPPRSKKICWLECPYCYGLSAKDNGFRLEKKRGLEILNDILDGGVKKIIFAGYATDPLNCSYIEDLLDLTIKKKAVFGFNTKAIKISDAFYHNLETNKIVKDSYISLSVDAGSNETYNKIHGVKSNVEIYDKVLLNTKKLGEIKNKNFFDLSAAYLVNIHSANPYDYEKFINDFIGAGCNLLRFTFPQPPKGIVTERGVIPSENEKITYKKILFELKNKYEKSNTTIMIVDADEENNIFNKPQTLPCYARFVYPTVGFDGWLYNCSQSSAPNFRSSALGNLNHYNFWELFYNYKIENFNDFMKSQNKCIKESNCRCDRKEHILNQQIINSRVFDN